MGFVDRFFGGSAFTVGDHSVKFNIPRDFGYVILVAISSTFLLVWLGSKVGQARKKYNIFYPVMYSSNNDMFNCIQRAHQNTLENYPTFLLLLFLGGLEMPLMSAVAGVIYLCGRVSYAKGYYTGDPKNRMRGVYAYIGLIALLIAAIKMGLKLVLALE